MIRPLLVGNLFQFHHPHQNGSRMSIIITIVIMTSYSQRISYNIRKIIKVFEIQLHT